MISARERDEKQRKLRPHAGDLVTETGHPQIRYAGPLGCVLLTDVESWAKTDEEILAGCHWDRQVY